MVDISKETKNAVKDIATDFSKDIKEAKERFIELLENPIVAKQPNSEELALKMLRASFSAEFGRPTQEYELYVLQKTAIREMPNKKEPGKTMRIASIFCLAVNVSGSDEAPRYTSIVHFDKEADLVNSVEEGKMYKARLSGGLKEEIYALSGTDITRYQETEDIPEEFSEPIEVIRKMFDKTEIAEGHSKIGSSLCWVEATISNVGLIPLKTGGKLGLVTVVDESLTPKDIQDMNGGLTVMLDSSQVRYGQLSQVGVLGNFTTHETYGLGMNGQIILPIVAFDFEPPVEDVSPGDTGLNAANENEEIVDIDDDDLDL